MPKRKKTIQILLVFSLMIIVFFGCSVKDENSPSASNIIKLTYNNGSQIRDGESLTVWMKNTSDDCVIFPHDFGIKISYEKDGKTYKVKNNVEYLPNTDKILDPAGSVFSEHEVFINPDLSNIKINGQTDFEASIAGYTCKNHSSVDARILFSVVP